MTDGCLPGWNLKRPASATVPIPVHGIDAWS